MHLFDDLKSTAEELKNYLLLYNIVLSSKRIAYYVELLEDRMLNKEPVIRYLEELVNTIKKEEPSSFNKSAYFIWKKEYPYLNTEEALEQFSIYNEKQRQRRMDKKIQVEQKREETQKKKDSRVKAQYLLSIYKPTNPSTTIAIINTNDFIIEEYSYYVTAAKKIGLKSPGSIWMMARKGYFINEIYLAREIKNSTNE